MKSTTPFLGLGLLVAWGLKSFSSRAGADDLGGILAPTCRLAELLSDVDFERELGAGWIDHSHRMIVGASCSGMNFLIISFLTVYCSIVQRVGSRAARCLLLAASLCVAWALTVATNATRIVLAAHLFSMDIYGGALTPARLHRAAGVLVYCLSLLLAHLAIERMADRLPGRRLAGRVPSALAPFGWYLGVTIGVPLVNRAWRHDAVGFLEHSAFVVSICLLAAAAGVGIRMAWGGGERRRSPIGMLESRRAESR